MVKIENVEELKRIIESDYGYVIIVNSNMKPTMHKTKCEQVSEDECIKAECNCCSNFHIRSGPKIKKD